MVRIQEIALQLILTRRPYQILDGNYVTCNCDEMGWYSQSIPPNPFVQVARGLHPSDALRMANVL